MSYTPLNNIILTGDPRGVTASSGDNDTSLATTAFVQTELGDYLPLAGGTMTGDITLGSGVDINFNDTNSGLQWSDVRLSRSAANIIALGSGDKIQQNAAPTAADDLTNKAYVDGLAAGIDVRASVRAATTANITLSGAQTIDGVSVIAGDRVLVKNQTTGSENGIYVAAAGAWSRATDADTDAEVTAGMFTFVEEGTANGDEGWVLVTDNPITLDTTPLTFSQFSSAVVVSTLDSLTDVDTTGVVDGALLRYEDTPGEWRDTSALLFTDANQLRILSDANTGGLVMGALADANLYRSAANVIKTDGQFSAVGDIIAQDGNAGQVIIGNEGPGSEAAVVFGSAADVNLYRSAANVLKTDDAFHVGGLLQALGNADVDGTLTVDSTSTLTGLATLTGGATTATGNYTTTSSGGFVASGTGSVSTNSGNISSTSGNLVITGGTSTLGGKVTMSAAQKVAVSSVKTANYTASITADYVIRVDSSGGGFTVSLPAGHAAGDTLVIKDVSGSAGTNNVIIDPNAAETIDGSATFTMSVNYQSVTVVSDGTNWAII